MTTNHLLISQLECQMEALLTSYRRSIENSDCQGSE